MAFTLTKLEQERERLAIRRHEVSGLADAAIDSSQAAAATVEVLETRRRRLTDQRTELQQSTITAKQETESLSQRLWDLRHRLEGVERELARHTTTTSRLHSLVPKDAILGQLSDFIHPDPGLAPLLDRVWHDWLQLPVIKVDGLANTVMRRNDI